MEINLKNFTMQFKALNLFGFIITTNESLKKVIMEADTMEVESTETNRLGGGV